MKTILFATKRVAAGSDWETGVFILILLVFAAVASAFVLAEVQGELMGGGGGQTFGNHHAFFSNKNSFLSVHMYALRFYF